jgi:PAS domain S-box-containing protein
MSRPADDAVEAPDVPFRELLERMPDAVVLVNADARIIHVNRAAEELFGYPSGELRGQQLGMLLPERYRVRHGELFRQFVLHPEPRRMGSGLALWARLRDGREIPVDIALTPWQSAQGLLIWAAIRDVTDRLSILAATQAAQATVATALDGCTTQPMRPNECCGAAATVVPEAGEAIAGVNWDAALESVGGDRELLEIVVAACLEELPKLQEELARAVRSPEPPVLRNLGHVIKGSVRIFGAGAVFRLAGRLEEMGRKAELFGLEQVHTELTREIDRFLAELKTPPPDHLPNRP